MSERIDYDKRIGLPDEITLDKDRIVIDHTIRFTNTEPKRKLTAKQIEVIESMQQGSQLKYYKAGCIANSSFRLVHKDGSYEKVNGKIGYALLESNLLKEMFKEIFTQYRITYTYDLC